MDPHNKKVHDVELTDGKVVPSFEVEKETGKNDLVYKKMESGISEQRLAEADDDGRWPPRNGKLLDFVVLSNHSLEFFWFPPP